MSPAHGGFAAGPLGLASEPHRSGLRPKPLSERGVVLSLGPRSSATLSCEELLEHSFERLVIVGQQRDPLEAQGGVVEN